MSSTNSSRAGRKKQLTSRQKEIIEILTRFTASQPVTAAMIAKMMGVSSRTILREIPRVEEWLTQNDFKFVRKPGVGFILDESVENQRLILELLEVEAVRRDYSKEERRRCILGELLYASQPLKSYYFTSKFHISEGTLSNDLDEVGAWLRQYNIELIRRPGLGIFIEGEERSYRQAIANIVYDSMDEGQIMQLLRGESSGSDSALASHNRVFKLIDRELTEKVEKILGESEERLNIHYADSAYVGLIVHISLAIKRIQNNEKIEMEQEQLQQLMMLPEFSVAEEICDRLKEMFHINIPRSEVGFVTMHLSSARIWTSDKRGVRSVDHVNLRQIVTEMIDIVEQDMGVVLHDSDFMLEDLCTHMAPTISRLTMGIPIENPQLSTIREEYPDVLQATVHACSVLCRELDIDSVPDSEAAYIAMHFGAALEKKLRQMRTVKAVVVCPTGVGTSRILEAGVKKAFSAIDIVGTISAFDIDTARLRQQGIDLIISTVRLTTDYPNITVSPILQEQDRRRIESLLGAVQSRKRLEQTPVKCRKMTEAEIRCIADTGEELLDLLQNLRFVTQHAARSRLEVIAQAGALFAEDDRAAADIETGLYERDRIADTYIKQFRALMLHCKTKMIDHARFGYIKLEPPVYENGKMMFGALVMLVPESEGDTGAVRDLIGAISALLVENKTLLEQLREGDWDGSRASIEAGLGVYYKQFLKKRIGVEGI